MGEFVREQQNIVAEKELLLGKLSDVLPADTIEIDREELADLVTRRVVEFQQLFSAAPHDEGIKLFAFDQRLRELQIKTADQFQTLDTVLPIKKPPTELFPDTFFTEDEIDFYRFTTPWASYVEAFGRYMAGAYPKREGATNF